MGKRMMLLLLVTGLAVSGFGRYVDRGLADDTEIYGKYGTVIRPNALIIFDNSGSMENNKDIPYNVYDPDTIYEGTYSNNAVYYKSTTTVTVTECMWYNPDGTCKFSKTYDKTVTTWLKATDSVDSLCQNETTQIEALKESGYATMLVSETGACSDTSKDLKMGNFLNYDVLYDATLATRIYVAKEVLAGKKTGTETVIIDGKSVTNTLTTGGILNKYSGIDFGLMVFNTGSVVSAVTNGISYWDRIDEGGKILIPIWDSTDENFKEADERQEMINTVWAISADANTPLAETLAEAGLYFAGETSWFNPLGSTTKTQYTSPIKYPCQKNIIIILTDGEPTADDDHRLYDTAYLNGLKIGDFDEDGIDMDILEDPPTEMEGVYDRTSHFLDDVAKFLHTQDVRPDWPVSPPNDLYDEQNLTIYTIGFGPDGDIPLLASTASKSEGDYFYASSISGLESAFETILGKVEKKNTVYVSPVVPVSRMNRTYAGNSIYIGFFRPEDNGRWSGNLKKYNVNENTGDILDADGDPAMADGVIRDDARSVWTEGEDDGPEVKKGGAGSKLIGKADSRNIYTYLEASTTLADAGNHFVDTNTALTYTLLDTAESSLSTLINEVRGEGLTWVLGDIVHSEPAVVTYDTNAVAGLDEGDTSYIFVGGNDGMLHCFDESSGEEKWSFIPPDQLPRLQLIFDTSTTDHDYFVDGVPRMICDGESKFCMASGEKRILFFGERRGGKYYYALDITDPTSPVYKYRIAPSILGDAADGIEQLGESWGTPLAATIKTGSGDTDTAKVVILPGGYDADIEDGTEPDSTPMGRAVLAVNLSDGSLSNFNFYHNDTDNQDMTHSIVDLNGYDTNDDGLLNRLYAPDLGGNVFAFEDDDMDGNWEKRLLFKASTEDYTRKIFGAPDMAMIAIPSAVTTAAWMGDIIFFGTGDREAPKEINTSSRNRFYAIKNYWDDGSVGLTHSDLYNATDNLIQDGSDSQEKQASQDLEAARGWYIDLTNNGEKVVSSPVLFNGVIYFTTFTPAASEAIDDDVCYGNAIRGEGRIYALDALTAAAVLNLDKDGGEYLNREDRSNVYTSSMPPSPMIAVFKDGAKLMLGGEGGIEETPVPVKIDLHKYYWRQFHN